MIMARKELRDAAEFDKAFPDGIYTEPSDGKRYKLREKIELVKELNRPLTDQEAERFRINK